MVWSQCLGPKLCAYAGPRTHTRTLLFFRNTADGDPDPEFDARSSARRPPDFDAQSSARRPPSIIVEQPEPTAQAQLSDRVAHTDRSDTVFGLYALEALDPPASALRPTSSLHRPEAVYGLDALEALGTPSEVSNATQQNRPSTVYGLDELELLSSPRSSNGLDSNRLDSNRQGSKISQSMVYGLDELERQPVPTGSDINTMPLMSEGVDQSMVCAMAIAGHHTPHTT